MFTDIISFSNIMSKDISAGLTALEKNSANHEKIVKKYSGQIIKKIGDGTLCIFNSVVDSIKCGIAILDQTKIIDLYQLRIGVHLGEIIFRDNDIFGEGVNIASRLESIAQPNSIIISKDINDQLLNYNNIKTSPLGHQSIKGLERSIEIFLIKQNHSLNDKSLISKKFIRNTKINQLTKSILVLPFTNKGNKDDEFYCYGMTNELVAELSYQSELKVNSIENYRIKDWPQLSFSEIAQQCNNNYILYGSIWKKDNNFQLNIELYDLKKQKITWADFWHENWDNLPNIIHKIIKNVCNIFNIKIDFPNDSRTTIPIITQAYDLYLEGKFIFQNRHSHDDIERAKKKLDDAIKLDKNLLQAHMLFSEILICEGKFYKSLKSYLKLFEKYVDKNDSIRVASCLNSIGDILFFIGRPNIALSYQNMALKICEASNNIRGIGYILNSIGNIYSHQGIVDKAEKNLCDSLKIRKMLDNKINIAITLGNISMAKLSKLEFIESKKYAFESLKLRKEFDEFYGLGIINNILGNIYFKERNFDKAKMYYDKSINYKKNINDKIGIVVSMNNLSSISFDNDDNIDAINILIDSLQIAEEIGYFIGTCEALEKLAIIYNKIGEFDKSKAYMNRALKISKQIGCDERITKILEKNDLINSGIKNKNLGITSSLVHNNLFPIKNIEISQLRDYKEINFDKVNTLINNNALHNSIEGNAFFQQRS